MNRFKNFLKKVVIWSDSQVLQISLVTFLFLLIFVLFIVTQNDVLSLLDITIISTFLITFFATLSFNKIIDSIRVYVEDDIKVNYDFNRIKTMYPLDVKKGSFYLDKNGKMWPIIILSEFPSDGSLIIKDSSTVYVLPSTLLNYKDNILKAHKASYIVNNKMLRLDKVELTENGTTLYTSRTTYLNTLMTNRAVDYTIAPNITIRDVIEPGPYINSLEDSILSNHIGFNIMILDNEGNVVLSERSHKVATDKKQLGFGVSGSLKSIYALGKNNTLSLEGIENAIIMEIKDELGLSQSQLNFSFPKNLLCIYREVFEGGKPHFLLSCKVNLSRSEIESIYLSNVELDYLKRDSSSLRFVRKIDLLNSNFNNRGIELPSKEVLNFASSNLALMKVAVDLLD